MSKGGKYTPDGVPSNGVAPSADSARVGVDGPLSDEHNPKAQELISVLKAGKTLLRDKSGGAAALARALSAARCAGCAAPRSAAPRASLARRRTDCARTVRSCASRRRCG